MSKSTDPIRTALVGLGCLAGAVIFTWFHVAFDGGEFYGVAFVVALVVYCVGFYEGGR